MLGFVAGRGGDPDMAQDEKPLIVDHKPTIDGNEKLAIIDDARTIDEEVPLTEEQKKRREEFIEEE